MLTRILASCYFLLKERRGIDYAKSAYKLNFGVFMSPYFFAIMIGVAILDHKFRVGRIVGPISLLIPLLLMSAYAVFIYLYCRSKEITDFQPEPNYKKLLLCTSLVGIISMFLVPYVLDHIVSNY